MIAALLDWIDGKPTLEYHRHKTLEDVSRDHGWTTGARLSNRTIEVLGVSASEIMARCHKAGSTRPLFDALDASS
mgnify:FL=1